MKMEDLENYKKKVDLLIVKFNAICEEEDVIGEQVLSACLYISAAILANKFNTPILDTYIESLKIAINDIKEYAEKNVD